MRLVDFDDAELCCQYDPLMSPLVWDLAHIGQQEELWLLRGGDPGQPGLLPPAVEGLYDAFEHSRASRVELPLLSPARARSYCATVRSAALDALAALPEDGDSFVFAMVISHENQHDETMLQALNLRTGSPLLAATSALPAGRPRMAGTSVLVAGGPFVLGVDAADEPCSLDNDVRLTSSTCPHSGSAGFRSPTVNGKTSSTTAVTPSRGGGRNVAGSTASARG